LNEQDIKHSNVKIYDKFYYIYPTFIHKKKCDMAVITRGAEKWKSSKFVG